MVVVTYEQRDRVWQWLSLSLLLHLILIFLFTNIEHEATQQPAPVVFFDESEKVHQQPVPQALPQQPLAPLPPPPALPKPDEDKEIDFALDLHENSRFGITKLFNEQPIIGNDPAAIQSDTPLGEEGAEEQVTDVSESEQPSLEQAAPTTMPFEPPVAINDQQAAPAVSNQAPDIPTPGPLLAETYVQEQPKIGTFPFTKKVKIRRKKSAGPITKNVSLADLAEGFVNYVKESDSRPIDINTNDYKYIGYMQKIGWFLQNSFHLHNRPLTLDHDVRMQTELHIAIDEQGNLTNMSFAPEVDEFVLHNHLMKIVKGAAPFPPLPKHFNQKSIKIKLPIHITASRGTHTYYFTFRG